MRHLIRRLIQFFFPVFILLVVLIGTYIWLDPFRVIRSYDDFYATPDKGCVILNPNYVSTALFDKNHKAENYNSFIFGNSRAYFYRLSEWDKHLPPNSNGFHFDGPGESLYLMEKKIEHIDAENVRIKNALLVIDGELLSQDMPGTDHLFMTAPRLVDNAGFFDFHLAFFKAFISPVFLYAYVDFKVSGKVKKYMKRNLVLNDFNARYNVRINEFDYYKLEDSIGENKYYTAEKLAEFYKRDTLQAYRIKIIKEGQQLLLNKVCAIFKKNHTNYKIIISPLYNQLKLAPEDKDYLERLFGRENVFDFSGINRFTNDYHNYYETSHYRLHVARAILDSVYKPTPDSSFFPNIAPHS